MGMLMLWGAPRSRSTAFYRMMIERGDFTGVHEPFSHVEVFGNAGVGGRPLATAQEVIAELRSLAATRQVFIKDTTDRRHTEALADRRFLATGSGFAGTADDLQNQPDGGGGPATGRSGGALLERRRRPS